MWFENALALVLLEQCSACAALQPSKGDFVYFAAQRQSQSRVGMRPSLKNFGSVSKKWACMTTQNVGTLHTVFQWQIGLCLPQDENKVGFQQALSQLKFELHSVGVDVLVWPMRWPLQRKLRTKKCSAMPRAVDF